MHDIHSISFTPRKAVFSLVVYVWKKRRYCCIYWEALTRTGYKGVLPSQQRVLLLYYTWDTSRVGQITGGREREMMWVAMMPSHAAAAASSQRA